ncbi:MAG: DUF3883 domain-containing protein [Minwuia sp.]|nr:DUF3883 domain-containing protein [Minwuia sp.]
MSGESPTGQDWTDREIDLIVADYFDMLRLELAGERYNKTEHRRALQQFVKRSDGSIEFKHQNISAVLREISLPWIWGYKPAKNYQKTALPEGIERCLGGQPSFLTIAAQPPAPSMPGMQESSIIYLDQAPTLVSSDAETTPEMRRLIRKFDPAARDARNRALGLQGEEKIFHDERARLIQMDRQDLARKVEWTSQERGDGAGYDIRSFDAQGQERLLEVKTTTGTRTTPFFISANEFRFSEERSDAFRLVRLFQFNHEPGGFELRPPLDRSVKLEATNYRASF